MSISRIDNLDLSDQERAEAIALRDRVNAEARENFHRDDYRKAVAEVIGEQIFYGFQHDNLLNLMSTVINAPWDARVTVSETRGMKAYWLARGGYIESSDLHTETVEITRDMVGFRVVQNLDQLRANFSFTQQTMIELGSQRLDAEVNSAALRLFQAAVPNSGNPSWITTTGLTLAQLDGALQGVREKSRTRVAAIIGRWTMTDEIVAALTNPAGGTYPGFIPSTNEKLLATGILGSYKGAPIISLTNWLDDAGQSFFPANELWVVSNDASQFVYWGGLETAEELQDFWYWNFIARREFGGIVHRPERLRRIVDTSKPAQG